MKSSQRVLRMRKRADFVSVRNKGQTIAMPNVVIQFLDCSKKMIKKILN